MDFYHRHYETRPYECDDNNDSAARNFQCFYDTGMVWTPETAFLGGHQQLASLRSDTSFMGNCTFRILFPGAGQSYGVRRQRRPVFPYPAQGDSGSGVAFGVYRSGHVHVFRREVSLESCGIVSMSGGSRLLRLPSREGLEGCGNKLSVNGVNIKTQITDIWTN